MTKRTPLKRTHAPRDVAQAISLFFAVRRIIRTKLAKGQKLDPATWLQVETMKFIFEHENSNMKDVADHLSITAPSTTSLISGLVESRLVASAVDRRDRRSSRLVLTQAGKAELKRALARGTKLLNGLFSVLSEKELAAFSGALKRIKDKSTGA